MWRKTGFSVGDSANISTHTSRVGCDTMALARALEQADFYSHIPCGMWPRTTNFSSGRQHFYSHIPCGMWQKSRFVRASKHAFLLTHPVWDVTDLPWKAGSLSQFLLTHPVWDVTIMDRLSLLVKAISTHTSRVGCDGICIYQQSCVFISTHTSRVGCDFAAHAFFIMFDISTHTSRVGCDKMRTDFSLTIKNFYSHIPCGMWPKKPLWHFRQEHFYSHIPCGMWLKLTLIYYQIRLISTHTSRVGCDVLQWELTQTT